ncbi:MAG: hypothetical protein LBK67_07680, partial [Coriobacteriales bacterium]|nr:hypothetical protein [Coriobacteriales bacterium]
MPWFTSTDTVLLAVIALVVLALVFYGVISGYRARRKLLRELDGQFGHPPRPEHKSKMEAAPRYWELRQKHEPSEDCVDDRTWDDLDMDRVFARINTCLTSVGDKYLYAVLHEPRPDEQKIREREALMAFLAENPATRLKL